jgi:prophage antirepressor-like protein
MPTTKTTRGGDKAMNRLALVKSENPSAVGNSVQVFEFDGCPVRAAVKGDRLEFVARDVCDAVECTWDGHRLDHVPAEWKGSVSVTTPRGNQEMVSLTEEGLYFFLARSDKPKALPFQKWISGEVLPDIRKFGMYATDGVVDQILSNPDFGITLLTKYKEERQKRLEAEQTNRILMHIGRTYTTTEIAKEIGFKSAQVLNDDLHEKGIQFKENKTWVLYSRYADLGYEEIKEEIGENGAVFYHRRWTQAGRKFILGLYVKEAAR